MRTLLRTALGLGWVCLLAGVLLQAVVKDRFEGVALLFYALPKPTLAMLAFILFVWPGSTRRWRLLAGVAALMISAWWLAVSWGNGPVQKTAARMGGEEVKILFWNLNRPLAIRQDLVDLVKEFQPHLAACVEPGPNAGKLCAEYEALLPGYKADWMPRGILWLSRVPSRYRDRGKLDNIGAFARFDVDGLGATFPMVVADVYGNLLRSRRHQLNEVLGHAQGRPDAIIAGDFNTPAESVFFGPYRAQFQEAFDTAGHGLRETWPLGLPLLSLDHVWVGTAWEVLGTRTEHRWSSDHDALLVTLRRR
jgi:hypothetical protein